MIEPTFSAVLPNGLPLLSIPCCQKTVRQMAIHALKSRYLSDLPWSISSEMRTATGCPPSCSRSTLKALPLVQMATLSGTSGLCIVLEGRATVTAYVGSIYGVRIIKVASFIFFEKLCVSTQSARKLQWNAHCTEIAKLRRDTYYNVGS